jgi:dsRNA-specific ribonuclease
MEIENSDSDQIISAPKRFKPNNQDFTQDNHACFEFEHNNTETSKLPAWPPCTVTPIMQVPAKTAQQDLLQTAGFVKGVLQHLYEVKQIKNIKFEMVSSEGPANSPTFKFNLNFNLCEDVFTFDGEGNSKKLAKKVATIKALLYLIKLPTLFSPLDGEYIKASVLLEIKASNIRFNIDEFMNNIVRPQERAEQESCSPAQEASTKINKNPLLDDKVKELMSTKNPLCLLSHLVPCNEFSFQLADESGQAHNKEFKIELKIRKSFIKRVLSLCDNNNNNNNNNTNSINDYAIFDFSSQLVTETDSDVIFHGMGKSKKIARYRSAHIALKTIYNINLFADGKLLSLL